MENDDVLQGTEEKEIELTPEELENISSFAISTKIQEMTIPIKTLEKFFPKVFMKLKRASIGELSRLQAPYAKAQVARSRSSGKELDAAIYGMWVERCMLQIVDFAIPKLDDSGKWDGRSVVRYDSKNNGDNRSNRDTFAAVPPAMAAWLGAAMDNVNGVMDEETSGDFLDWFEQLKR